MNVPVSLPVSVPRLLAVALALALFPFAATAQYSNAIVWTTNYYSVTGANFSEIRQSIAAARPSKDAFDGDTRWNVDWKFKLTDSGNGCVCSNYGTMTRIVTTLPRWKPAPNTSKETYDYWARFIQSLAQHEAGHARFAVVTAAEIGRSIGGVGTLPDCEALKQSINERANRIVDDYRQREKEYDRRTEHGARPPDKP